MVAWGVGRRAIGRIEGDRKRDRWREEPSVVGRNRKEFRPPDAALAYPRSFNLSPSISGSGPTPQGDRRKDYKLFSKLDIALTAESWNNFEIEDEKQ